MGVRWRCTATATLTAWSTIVWSSDVDTCRIRVVAPHEVMLQAARPRSATYYPAYGRYYSPREPCWFFGHASSRDSDTQPQNDSQQWVWENGRRRFLCILKPLIINIIVLSGRLFVVVIDIISDAVCPARCFQEHRDSRRELRLGKGKPYTLSD